MKNDIFNTIIATGKSEGLKVFSAVKVQCPVWVVHLKMDSRDNDPFFPVDKSILSLLDGNPSATAFEISNLIGLEKTFVEGRIGFLSGMEMIEKIDGEKYITEKAKEWYLNEAGERPIVTIYDDLVLDGLTLKPLDRWFYECRASYSSRRSDVVVPRVIMGKDDPALVRAVKAVEKLNGKEKEALLLEHDSFNYDIQGFEAKSIDNVYVVMAINPETGKGVRRIFYKDRFIPKVDSLEGSLDKYYLYLHNGSCHCSCGFMPLEGNPFVAMKEPEIKIHLYLMLHTARPLSQDYMYTPEFGNGGEYPLTYIVSEELLERSEDPRDVMDAALAGRIVEYTAEGTRKTQDGKTIKRIGGYFWIPVKNIIPDKVEHYRALRKWQREKGRVDISFIRSLEPEWTSWREDFVKLGLLDELESIDISLFINENRKKEEEYE